jgi:hypothetical protein
VRDFADDRTVDRTGERTVERFSVADFSSVVAQLSGSRGVSSHSRHVPAPTRSRRSASLSGCW